jgi:hypothetical protein
VDVYGKLIQAQVEWITTAQRATVNHSRGMMYWDYETQDILISDGATLVQYKRSNIEGVLGEIRSSLLTEAQFQAETDSTWVLCDGRSVIGSDYQILTGNNSIPDARGVFLRGKNNGRVDGNQNPDGDSALGAFQADRSVRIDTLETSGSFAVATGTINPDDDGNFTPYIRTGQDGGNIYSLRAKTNGGETRPSNVTVNHFIKINRE